MERLLQPKGDAPRRPRPRPPRRRWRAQRRGHRAAPGMAGTAVITTSSASAQAVDTTVASCLCLQGAGVVAAPVRQHTVAVGEQISGKRSCVLVITGPGNSVLHRPGLYVYGLDEGKR